MKNHTNQHKQAIPSLSIIIVNWNTRVLLAQCLDSVFSQSYPFDIEVIVLDSASSDGSPSMVEENFPVVRLIKSDENLGFAKGNNVAISQANGRYILLLNPDTVVHDNALTALHSIIANQPNLGIIGAQLLNTDGSLQHSFGVFPSLQAEIPLLNRLSHMKDQKDFEADSGNKVSLVPVDWVSGACFLVKRKVINEVGLLDEAYWLYTEEADFCYRVQAAGWGVASFPQARITHIARAASRQRYKKTMLYFYQSKVRFIAKHEGRGKANIAKKIIATKAMVWMRSPSRSPLSRSYGTELSREQIKDAYADLNKAMKLPLEELLSCHWE